MDSFVLRSVNYHSLFDVFSTDLFKTKTLKTVWVPFYSCHFLHMMTIYNHMLSPSTYTAPSCTAVLATILPAAACCSRRALRPKGGRRKTPQKKSHLFEKRNAVSNIQGQPL